MMFPGGQRRSPEGRSVRLYTRVLWLASTLVQPGAGRGLCQLAATGGGGYFPVGSPFLLIVIGQPRLIVIGVPPPEMYEQPQDERDRHDG